MLRIEGGASILFHREHPVAPELPQPAVADRQSPIPRRSARPETSAQQASRGDGNHVSAGQAARLCGAQRRSEQQACSQGGGVPGTAGARQAPGAHGTGGRAAAGGQPCARHRCAAGQRSTDCRLIPCSCTLCTGALAAAVACGRDPAGFLHTLPNALRCCARLQSMPLSLGRTSRPRRMVGGAAAVCIATAARCTLAMEPRPQPNSAQRPHWCWRLWALFNCRRLWRSDGGGCQVSAPYSAQPAVMHCPSLCRVQQRLSQGPAPPSLQPDWPTRRSGGPAAQVCL